MLLNILALEITGVRITILFNELMLKISVTFKFYKNIQHLNEYIYRILLLGKFEMY